ncbi:L protein [Lyssavirus mokola]|uniref:Large structural protein n=3 Tax=Mokola virus TaxID=12538 RepID=L_MOKV|nr:L protein [Lyssavirus mokola]P0C568.1 RecName: Full=Large structural protein; Short=Protein L; AltName: Full=Replicase; AltName: Full=Transcriptase; Includes: RecName: Full=RNA-directed RNA polymerase; Includes: RecName: Full=GTP phosphohydrolase; Includes: RecName: Full=GDP polyribonucleotidyltransferase; AltName: Full=PRNTase; Includes: RecName: Full=mRNA cap methyltransferase; AltName: Full=mRNA (guanine-N(7)-)-methyltransferase; Short=G-N7-MTase; AltName: Full=mRNA (nucleoside-2'-O-)-methyl
MMDVTEVYDDPIDPVEPEGEWNSSPVVPNILRNSDYNLNSPLLEDPANLMIQWLTSGNRPSRMNVTENTTRSYKVLRALFKGVDIATIKIGGVGAQAMMGLWVLGSHSESSRSRKCLADLSAFYQRTLPIESILNHTLMNRGLQTPREGVLSGLNRVSYDQSFGRYLGNLYSSYLLFHVIILYMNALDWEEEKTILALWRDITSIDIKNDRVYFKDPLWGKLLVTKDFVYAHNSNCLFDKNYTLMLKDLFLSRFNSLLILVSPPDSRYSDDLAANLCRLYISGDRLLSSCGNAGYDVIKMLEPCVVDLLVQRAETFRPLIHSLGEFPAFIKDKTTQLIGTFGPCASQFFSMLQQFDNIHDLVFIYGCYRHWGHPYIDYRKGLSKLFDQVHMKKTIDQQYQERLASDLARKILRWGFEKYSKWYLDTGVIPKDHPLAPYIATQTWPPKHVVDLLGDSWHTLPMTQIFEVPESMDPSEILDDKSHSFTRTKLSSWSSEHRGGPVPSEKVIITALSRPPVNPRDFLKSIDQGGLPDDDLIIGLKPKERELKIDGRFFALMSWNLRLYFVITEKLLANHIIPLFDALTMTDNLNKVFKKLIDRVTGQGLKDYSRVTYAFHLDYEKWNNHQRLESTKDVFSVLDRAFGMKKVFSRTHEFFQKSWIYYSDRSDLIGIWKDQIYCLDMTEGPTCWNGQDGGLEGLRQKGWSLVSLLMIERESKTRNTRTKILAQGDNQVLCPTYMLSSGLNNEGLRYELENISKNAMSIYRAIEDGASKLGLIIKKEETMCSFDFLIYGKTPLFRGNILVPESKRWARVSCISNDQIVNLANIMSTVSTNALTVAQHSQSLVKPMRDFLLMSVQAIYHYLLFSPIIKDRVYKVLNSKDDDFLLAMSRIIYLDPSLGGVSGMSLGRFPIRQFSDPVSEGLTFWKEIWLSSSETWIHHLCQEAGNPDLGDRSLESFTRLLEDPTTLNIRGGASPTILLKEAIRKALYDEVDRVENSEFREAIILSKTHRDNFILFLKSIEPLFPRFLSELFSSSFLGIPESIIGLIQNSRTVRRQFRKSLSKTLEESFLNSEIHGINRVTQTPQRLGRVWTCSAERADQLREISWGRKVVGTTVPNPSEMLTLVPKSSVACGCYTREVGNPRISVSVLPSFDPSFLSRGPLKGYLGSSTSMSTQLFHSWEKVTNVHVVKRALSLKESINWFVSRESNLAKTLIGNILSLTGPSFPIEEAPVFKRTGSALHRFKSARYSEGGYSAVCPNLLSHISVSTDTMSDLTQDGTNFDFMFQPLMLYAQTWTSELVQKDFRLADSTFHWHLRCQKCIRPIEEVTLDAPQLFDFPDISSRISRMVSGAVPQFRKLPEVGLKAGDLTALSSSERSYHIGTAQGLLYSILVAVHDPGYNDNSLFPVNIYGKVSARGYLRGLARGILIGSSICFLTRMTNININRPLELISGVISYILLKLDNHPSLYIMLKEPELRAEIFSIPQKVPAAYPTTMEEGNRSVLCYLQQVLRYERDSMSFPPGNDILWIFSDFRSIKMTYLTLITFQAYLWLQRVERNLSKQVRVRLRQLNSLMRQVLGGHGEDTIDSDDEILSLLKESLRRTRWVDQEVRHAAKSMTPDLNPVPKISRRMGSSEWICSAQQIAISTSLNPASASDIDLRSLSRQYQNPLISGLRVVQWATGAHYKIKPILNDLDVCPCLSLVIGDGSGGISRVVLSMFPDSKLVFNSLLEVNDLMASGTHPLPPSALMRGGDDITSRVIDFESIWEKPSDLRNPLTWKYFHSIQSKLRSQFDLIVCDAEVTDIESVNKITLLLSDFSMSIKGPLYLIFKTYGTMLVNPDYKAIHHLSRAFPNVTGFVTQMTSSFSSEIYLRFSKTGYFFRDHELLTASTVREMSLVLFNCSNPKSEMLRARTLNYQDLIRGFPPEIISNPYNEMIITLIDSEVESFLVHKVVDDLELKRGAPSKMAIIIAVAILFSNSVLNVSKSLNEPKFFPPSDPKLLRHFNICSSTLLFLSTALGDLSNFTRLHELYNSPVTYYFGKQTIKGRRYLSWSWANSSPIFKKVACNSSISLSSHWIRLIYKIVKTTRLNCSPRDMLRETEACLRTYNKWINIRDTRSRTSILDYCCL